MLNQCECVGEIAVGAKLWESLLKSVPFYNGPKEPPPQWNSPSRTWGGFYRPFIAAPEINGLPRGSNPIEEKTKLLKRGRKTWSSKDGLSKRQHNIFWLCTKKRAFKDEERSNKNSFVHSYCQPWDKDCFKRKKNKYFWKYYKPSNQPCGSKKGNH